MVVMNNCSVQRHAIHRHVDQIPGGSFLRSPLYGLSKETRHDYLTGVAMTCFVCGPLSSANSAHIRQSRPDSGLDLSHFQSKVFPNLHASSESFHIKVCSTFQGASRTAAGTTLETPQGQIGGAFSQLLYKCYLAEVAFVGD